MALSEEVAQQTIRQRQLSSTNHAILQQHLETPYVYDPYQYCMRYRHDCGGGGRTLTVPPSANNRAAAADALSSSLPQDDAFSGVEDLFTKCHCSLNVDNLFDNANRDIPRPLPPISKCELHEILRSLPPRFQNRPWRLCYDTSRDGSSLHNFYRAMEPVYTAGECGLGIFLLTERKQSTKTSLCEVDDSDDDAREEERRRQSALRRAQKLGKPMGIVGCFTPHVPCLESHGGGQHAFYGSPETFVFKLRLAGKRIGYDSLLATPKPSLSSAASRVSDHPHSHREGENGGGSCSPPELTLTAAALGQRADLQSASTRNLFIDEDAGTLILPMATRHSRLGDPAEPDRCRCPDTAEPDDNATEEQDEAAEDVPHISPTYVASPTSRTFPQYTAAPARTAQAEATESPNTAAPPPESREKKEVPPPVTQHLSLLEKYKWCGNPSKRQFVLAQNHFFAIGGGAAGAALYVDENLQYCTSSAHCETFASPPLFGGRPPVGLRHTESMIVRMIWFAIRDNKERPSAASAPGEFRMMTFTQEEEEARAEQEGKTREAVSLCRCGRRSAEWESSHRASATVAMPTHRCNEGYFAF